MCLLRRTDKIPKKGMFIKMTERTEYGRGMGRCAIKSFATLALLWLVWPGTFTLWGWITAGLWMTLLYTVMRPLLRAVTLPFSMVLLGICGPLMDGLLIWWAGAWAWGPVEMGFGQVLLGALLFLLLERVFPKSPGLVP